MPFIGEYHQYSIKSLWYINHTGNLYNADACPKRHGNQTANAGVYADILQLSVSIYVWCLCIEYIKLMLYSHTVNVLIPIGVKRETQCTIGVRSKIWVKLMSKVGVY